MSKRSAKVKIIFGLVLLFLIVTRTSLARVPQVLHVLIVLEENTDYADVCGPNHISMPFLCGLKSQGSFSANYYAPTHPSIGNYNDLGWGVVTTNNDGCVPTSCGFPYTGDNIVRELNAVGKTWKGYAESLPSTCYLGGDSGQYAVRHSPIPYISDVQSNCLNGYVAFEDPNLGFAHDLAANTLPNYAFITPNLCDDAHDCTLPGSLIPDQWVQNNVIQPLLNGGMVVPGQRLRWISPPLGGQMELTRLLWLIAALALLATIVVGRRRQVRRTLGLAMLMVVLGAGCSGVVKGTTSSGAGTPPNTYTLTLAGTSGTGSSALAHSITVNVTVN